METVPKKVILETLTAAEEYVNHLDALLLSARETEIQIDASSQSAIQLVESTFESLTNAVLNMISCRKLDVLSAIEKTTEECTLPIKLCQAKIAQNRRIGTDLIAFAKKVLSCGGFTSPEMCNDFMNDSSKLGMLPVLPDNELIPNITFQASLDTIISYIEEKVQSFGNVCKIGPVQITLTEPRPGSLLGKTLTPISAMTLSFTACKSLSTRPGARPEMTVYSVTFIQEQIVLI